MAGLPKADTLPVGHTQAAQEMNPNEGRVYKNDNRMVSASDVFEARPEGYDFTHVSDAEARAMGADPNTHVPCLIRNPDIYQQVEKKNRATEFLSTGGRFIPLDPKTGKPYMNGDLIYAFRSRAEAEHNARIEREEADRYVRDLESPTSQLGDTPRYEQRRITTDDSRREHERNRADGMIGPTQGQDWRDVARRNPERFEKDKQFYAFGGRHVDPEPGRADNYEAGLQPRRQEPRSPTVGYSRNLEKNWPASMQKKK